MLSVCMPWLIVALQVFVGPCTGAAQNTDTALADAVAEGNEILAAFREYKLRMGIWPELFEDLSSPDQRGRERHGTEWNPPETSPQVLTGMRASASTIEPGWVYKWWRTKHTGVESLSFVFSDGRVLSAAPRTGSWMLRNGRELSVASGTCFIGSFPSVPADDVIARQFGELERRRVRSPSNVWHGRGLAQLFLRIGREEDAYRTCIENLEQAPSDWWSAILKAQLGLRQSSQRRDSVAEYKAWCERNPGYTHYWVLSVFYREIDEDEKAIGATASMAEHTPQGWSAGYTLAFVSFDAARFAYSRGQFRIAVEICDRWSGLGYLPDCMRVLRAHALLALGEFDSAALSVAKADCSGCPDGVGDCWALEYAIRQRDCGYRGDFGTPVQRLGLLTIEYE